MEAMRPLPSEIIFQEVNERTHSKRVTIPDMRGIHRRFTFPWAGRRRLRGKHSRHFSLLRKEMILSAKKLLVGMERVGK